MNEEFGRTLYGFKIIESVYLTEKVWVFPKERFFEWEPKDEAMCRRLGIGHEVERGMCYRVGDTLVAHPSVVREMEKQARIEISLQNIGPIRIPQPVKTFA